MPERGDFPSRDHSMWSELDVARRARIIANVADQVAENIDSLVALSRTSQRILDTETLSSELIPFAEACRFLGKRAARVLAKRNYGWTGRPVWLWGVRSTVERVPLGTVLVLGAWNYPLMLAGIQSAQALVAGNRVLWKPAPGCEAITTEIVRCFHRSGVPTETLECLPSDVDSACRAIDEGVDLVVLTGAATTGRAVMRRAADKLTPAIMELSGCDAMVVTAEADLIQAAKSLKFGLTLNSGATCIAPRRVFVHHRVESEFRKLLLGELSGMPEFSVHPAARATVARVISDAMGLGARSITGSSLDSNFLDHGKMSPMVLEEVHEGAELVDADVFAPIAGLYSWCDEDWLIRALNGCRYGLGASLFGDIASCKRLASSLSVGSIVINDLIVPTADPRLPFGGRRESGFGLTRGVEGLLSMTAARVISVRKGGGMPHLQPSSGSTELILRGVIQFRFASSLRKRLAGLQQLVRGVRLSKTEFRSNEGESP